MNPQIKLLCRRIESGGLEALTPAERQLFAINWLLVEINIGGLHQFFYNDAGKFAADVLSGLQAIGAHEMAAIFKNAVALFPGGRVPVIQSERQHALENLVPEVRWEYLGELTAQLFRVGEDVPKLAESYLAANGVLFPALANS